MLALFIALAIFALGSVVAVHELGHFLAAKLLKFPVRTFALGFGPALPGCRVKYRDTEYRLNALPLGGYVTISGLDGEMTEESDGENAPERAKSPVRPGSHRLVVALGGPIASVVYGFAILFVLTLTQGTVIEFGPVTVTRILADSPAARAGLQEGDLITAIDGKALDGMTGFMREIGVHQPGDRVDLSLERSSQPLTLSLEPQRISLPQDRNVIFGIGIEGTSAFRRESVGIVQAFQQATSMTTSLALWPLTVAQELRAGRMHARDLVTQGRGPVGVVTMLYDSIRAGIGAGLFLIAILSITVAGTMQLIPVPPFDGGHVMALLYEAIFGRPIPLPVRVGIAIPVVATLLVFTAYITIHDTAALF